MKKLIILLPLILLSADKPKLTAEDREPVHLVFEQLINSEAQMLQLQQQHEKLQKDYATLLEGLKKKCGGDVEMDKDHKYQCK